MMAVLGRMSTHGKLPSWEALTEAVQALARAGDWERLHDIVRDVRKGEGIARGVTGGVGRQKRFFVIVERLGVDLSQFDVQDGAQVAEQESGRLDADAEQREAQRAWNEQVNSEADELAEALGNEEVNSEAEGPAGLPGDVRFVDQAPGEVLDDDFVRQKPVGDDKKLDWKEDNGSIGGVPL